METGLVAAGAPGAPGASGAELARRLPPARHGDPLGLGRPRGPAPADPDPFSAERDAAEFARSLLPAEERAALEGEPPLSIADVRACVRQNAVRGGEGSGPAPEVIAFLDARIDYKVFIAGDNAYTREELYEAFPFQELGAQPEAVFAQQEICVFPPKATALSARLEYAARDRGDESLEFVAIEDLVASAARPGLGPRRRPLKVALTKVYVGKEAWEDFLVLQRAARATARIALAQGRAPGAPGAPQLRDEPKAEAARREGEARARLEALEAREAAAAAAAEAAEARREILEADLRRLEASLRARAPPP